MGESTVQMDRSENSERGSGREDSEAQDGAWGFVKTVASEFLEDDVPGQAAKVAYFAFLALPPTFMVLFSLTGMFGDQTVADWITSRLSAALPPSTSSLVTSFVEQVVLENAPGALSVGLLVALWGSSNVFMGLGAALNAAYDIEESRPWWRRRLLAIGVMLIFAGFFVGGSALLIIGPMIAEPLGLAGVAEQIWNLVQWPVALVLVVIAFWTVYRLLPNRDQSSHNSELLKSAAFGALLWIAATAGFRIYISNFSSYNETYGFLGTVIVLLLWLYVTGIVILTGGEVAAELERRA